jgi:hypothetical protein
MAWRAVHFPSLHQSATRIEDLSKTIARIRYSRGAREAIATSVKVAGICTSDVKAEELDSTCGCGRWLRTNGGGNGGGKHQQQQQEEWNGMEC